MSDQTFPAHIPTEQHVNGEVIEAEHQNQIRNEISALFFGFPLPVSGAIEMLTYSGDRISTRTTSKPIASTSYTWTLDQIQTIVSIFNVGELNITRTETFVFTGDKLTGVTYT